MSERARAWARQHERDLIALASLFALAVVGASPMMFGEAIGRGDTAPHVLELELLARGAEFTDRHFLGFDLLGLHSPHVFTFGAWLVRAGLSPLVVYLGLTYTFYFFVVGTAFLFARAVSDTWTAWLTAILFGVVPLQVTGITALLTGMWPSAMALAMAMLVGQRLMRLDAPTFAAAPWKHTFEVALFMSVIGPMHAYGVVVMGCVVVGVSTMWLLESRRAAWRPIAHVVLGCAIGCLVMSPFLVRLRANTSGVAYPNVRIGLDAIRLFAWGPFEVQAHLVWLHLGALVFAIAAVVGAMRARTRGDRFSRAMLVAAITAVVLLAVVDLSGTRALGFAYSRLAVYARGFLIPSAAIGMTVFRETVSRELRRAAAGVVAFVAVAGSYSALDQTMPTPGSMAELRQAFAWLRAHPTDGRTWVQNGEDMYESGFFAGHPLSLVATEGDAWVVGANYFGIPFPGALHAETAQGLVFGERRASDASLDTGDTWAITRYVVVLPVSRKRFAHLAGLTRTYTSDHIAVFERTHAGRPAYATSEGRTLVAEREDEGSVWRVHAGDATSFVLALGQHPWLEAHDAAGHRLVMGRGRWGHSLISGEAPLGDVTIRFVPPPWRWAGTLVGGVLLVGLFMLARQRTPRRTEP